MVETTTAKCAAPHADDDALDGVMSDADVYIAATDDGVVPLQPPLQPQSQTQQQQSLPPRRASLPPIALARPVGAANTARGLSSMTPNATGSRGNGGVRFMLVQATPGAASSEPFTLRSLSHSQPQPRTAAPSLVVVLTRAQIEAVEQYRWIAFFIFLLYVMTFFAWPSYIMSACGLATGLVGYGSCRMSQQGSRHNLSWVILFIAANYVMMLFLGWVFASFFVRDLQTHPNDGQPAAILLAVFVALGLLLHVRALRIARDFLQAFRAGVALLPRRGSLTVVRPPRRAVYAHDVAASGATAVISGTSVAHAA